MKKATTNAAMSLLLNNTEESFILIGTDFRVIIFNKQFESLYKKFFGKQAAEGDSIFDYTQPERRDIVKEIYLKVFAGEKLQSEIELSLPDNTVNYFVNKFKPAHDEEGHIIGAFVTISDITEKREAERRVREERMLLRTLIDNLPLNVYTKDLDSKKTLANRTDYEYAGFTKEEDVLGKDDLELFSEQSAKNTIEEDKKIFQTGEGIIGKEENHIRKDGREIWFLISKIPIKNEDGEITGLLGISYDITERKEAQEKVRIAKERYDIVTKATNEAIWDWDLFTNHVHWGDGFKTLFGHNAEKESVTLESWTSYIHPDDEQKVIDSIMEVINSPETSKWEQEYRFRKTDGSYAEVLDRGFVIRNAGRPTRMIGAMQDITQRKHAEDVLKRNKTQLSIATKLAKLAYWELNITEGVFTFNDHFYEMLKTTAEEMGGYTMSARDYFERFLHPDDADMVRDEVIKAVETTELNYTHHLEHRVIYADGNIGYLTARFFAVKDEQGRTIKTVGANQDITDRKKVEEELRLSNERYNMVAKATNDAVYEWDIVNKVTYWGEGYETLFGHKRTSDKMSAGSWLANLHPDEKEELLKRTNEALENKETSLTRELRFRCADDSYKTVFDKLMILYNSAGQPIKVLGAIQDITERKQNELAVKELNQQLNKRAEELAASNAELEQFAYVASHDLQEPLRMVSSFLQLLQKKYNDQLDSTATQYITYAVDGADRMKQLIMDLLEYSRVGTNQDKRVKADIGEIVSHVLDIFADKITDTNAVINVQPMPSIKINKTQITQLIQNLVGNALKYNTSLVPEVEIGCEEKTDAWQFSIKDNGIGIDPKFYEKIFIIFQRLHNKNQFSGTGIGLAICKKIVERHGGTIWIQSAAGKGSTFFFTIKK